MKPIIIQVPSGKDSKFSLTVKELQEMLDQAYEAGKKDGSTIHYDCPNRWWWSNSPSITWTTTTPQYDPDYTKIYCKTDSDHATNGCCDCTYSKNNTSSVTTVSSLNATL